jgi:hypothetical protein
MRITCFQWQPFLIVSGSFEVVVDAVIPVEEHPEWMCAQETGLIVVLSKLINEVAFPIIIVKGGIRGIMIEEITLDSATDPSVLIIFVRSNILRKGKDTSIGIVVSQEPAGIMRYPVLFIVVIIDPVFEIGSIAVIAVVEDQPVLFIVHEPVVGIACAPVVIADIHRIAEFVVFESQRAGASVVSMGDGFDPAIIFDTAGMVFDVIVELVAACK